MARQRHLETAAEAVAEERRDPRFAHGLDRREDAQALIEEGVEAALLLDAVRQLLQVHADREVVIPGGGEDHGAHGVVLGERADEGLEGVHEGDREPVVRRVVDRHGDDGAAALDEHRLAAHRAPSRLRSVSHGRHPDSSRMRSSSVRSVVAA